MVKCCEKKQYLKYFELECFLFVIKVLKSGGTNFSPGWREYYLECPTGTNQLRQKPLVWFK
jgi:hypothetical protein